MNVQYMSIEDIRPYERNPRKNDGAVEYVANSIREFGWKQPIVVDKNGVIIAGHTRYKAAKKLKMKEVPVIVADDLTDEQVKAYRLADNKTGEMADWEENLLDELLSEICGIDMENFGFESQQVEKQEVYTSKITIPEYEMTTESPPELWELYDDTKTQKLIAEIEKTSISEDEKRFLRLAAYRHVVFNYGKIAEYYAHAKETMQEEMERSVLVIIDYDRAIMDGYVKLHDEIAELMGFDTGEV